MSSSKHRGGCLRRSNVYRELASGSPGNSPPPAFPTLQKSRQRQTRTGQAFASRARKSLRARAPEPARERREFAGGRQRRPRRITDILLEVDDATRFTEAFTHLRTGSPSRDRIGLLNVLLAEGINLGLRKMAEATTTPRVVLDDYLLAIDQLEARLAELDAQLATVATTDPYREPVGWLRCFRGIDTLTAMLLLAELHDVQRFPTARALMAYLGLVPGEHSSGERHRRGPITKTGNTLARRLVVEAAWHLSAPARRQPDAGPAAERATATGDCAGGQGAAAVVSPLPAAGRAQAGPGRHGGGGPRAGRISVGRLAPGDGMNRGAVRHSAAIAGGPPVPGEHPGGSLAGRGQLTGELRAKARRGDRHRGARGGAPGVVQFGEVRRQRCVVELAAVEPGVEPPERAGVGPSGVRADGGLDQPASGRSRAADLGLFGVDPGGPIIHVKW